MTVTPERAIAPCRIVIIHDSMAIIHHPIVIIHDSRVIIHDPMVIIQCLMVNVQCLMVNVLYRMAIVHDPMVIISYSVKKILYFAWIDRYPISNFHHRISNEVGRI
ncbi:MAG: hypothetical protein ACFE0I_08385 [Elainellaceae cyanobacterium]